MTKSSKNLDFTKCHNLLITVYNELRVMLDSVSKCLNFEASKVNLAFNDLNVLKFLDGMKSIYLTLY